MENSKIMVQNNLTAVVYTRKAKALEAIKEALKSFDGKIVNVSLQKKLSESMNVGYEQSVGHLQNEWDLESIYYKKETVGWREVTDKFTLTIRVKEEYSKYENYRGEICYVCSNNDTPATDFELVVEDKRLNYEKTAEKIQSHIDYANKQAEAYSFDSRTVEEFADLFIQLDKQFEKLKDETSYELQNTIKELYGRQISNLMHKF